MRVLIVHGFLLRGTGSNVYNARLAAALARAGHDVHVVCQERAPEGMDGVVAAGDWDGGTLRVRRFADGPGVTVYRPDIGGLLPVYVADRYDGVEARPLPELSDAEVARFVGCCVEAVAEVCDRVAPDVALANHLVLQPAIVARAVRGRGIPYAVKVHGSALEYTVKPHPERFLPWAREGLADAATVLVGSRHTAQSLWAAMGDASLPDRTRLGPPGVDVAAFRPRPVAQAAADVRALAGRLAVAPADADEGSAFARDLGATAAALRSLRPGRDRHVAFVGKLIVSKGLDVLAAAWPLVLARVPDARLVVVGFGAYRSPLEWLLKALALGDLAAVREIAAAGRALEGGPRAPLERLEQFLDAMSPREQAAYFDAARALPDRVVFTGRMEHDELAPLLSMCVAQVVPSTFPEAFGMVAAEAAACGTFPISARHSGLAEVAEVLRPALPEAARGWLTFPVGASAVDALAARLVAVLTADPELLAKAREGLVRVARERFSWDGVAAGVIAAAQGRWEDLAPVAA